MHFAGSLGSMTEISSSPRKYTESGAKPETNSLCVKAYLANNSEILEADHSIPDTPEATKPETRPELDML